MESPWNNDLHHMRVVENETHYYKMINEEAFQPVRNRNPLCLSLKEMCDDETAAAKFAVRQVNGIAPKLSVRSEPKTGRKCEKTIDLLRETTGIFEKEIPALRQQVAAAEKRIAQLERNKFRRGRSKSAAAGRSKLPWGKVGQDRTQRQMYLPSARPEIDELPSERSQSACSAAQHRICIVRCFCSSLQRSSNTQASNRKDNKEHLVAPTPKWLFRLITAREGNEELRGERYTNAHGPMAHCRLFVWRSASEASQTKLSYGDKQLSTSSRLSGTRP